MGDESPGRKAQREAAGLLLSFPSSVSSLVPGNGVKKEAIFLFSVHIYSIHIYLYHILLNQKVEFSMKYLFFNNHLVFNCDQNYDVQSLRGF